MNSSAQFESVVPVSVKDYAAAIEGLSIGRFTSQLNNEGKMFFASHYGAPFFALAKLAPELQTKPNINVLIASPGESFAADGGRWLSLYSKGQKVFEKFSITVCSPSPARSTKPPKPLLFQPNQQILVKHWNKHLRDLESPPDVVVLYIKSDFEKIEALVADLCQLSKGRKALVGCHSRVEAIIVQAMLKARGCQISELLGFDLNADEPQHYAAGAWWVSAIPPEDICDPPDDAWVRHLRLSYKCLEDYISAAKNRKDAGKVASLYATRTTENIEGAVVNAVRVASDGGFDIDTGRLFGCKDQEGGAFSWLDKALNANLVSMAPNVRVDATPDENRVDLIVWLGKILDDAAPFTTGGASAEREVAQATEVDALPSANSAPPVTKPPVAVPDEAAIQGGIDVPVLEPTAHARAPRRSRLSRSAGTVNVLAFAAMLGKSEQSQASEAFDQAKQKLLLWLSGKGFKGLSSSANQHVELPDGEVSIETDDQTIWAMRFDDRRGMEQGAIWRVEATLLGGDAPAISLRLAQVRSSEDAPPPVASGVPQVVATIAQDVGLQDAGASLLNTAVRLSGKAGLEWLVRLLLNVHRTQPVVVFSGDIDTSANRLAARLTGVAHVVCVDKNLSEGLTRYFGRERSVFGNAVRLYRPGFTADADSYQHPVWPLKGTQLPKWLSNDLFEETCAISLEVGDLDDRAPSFQVVRSHLAEKRLASSEKRLASLRQQAESIASSKDEQIDQLRAILAEQESALNEYKSKAQELDEQLSQLQGELQATRRERDGAIEETRQLRYQLSNQWDNNGDSEANLADESYYPDNWDELEDWVEIYGDNKLILLPQAVKAAKESQFKDVPFAYKAMEYLVRYYIPMKTRGKDDIQPFHDEKQALERLGLEREPVGSALDDHRYKHEYRRQYDGRTIMLDDHLKWGKGFDPAVIFRLYFYYDEDTAKVIIGHLPTHLTNRITHST